VTSSPVCFVGGDRDARATAVRRQLADRSRHEIRTAAAWPFQRDVVGSPIPPERIVWLRDLHLAFPAGQTSGTRLVLTQSTYQLQRWLDWADATPHAALVADADRASLERSSPEAFTGRGPWRRVALVDIDAASSGAAPAALSDQDRPGRHVLHEAFMQADGRQRLDACREALEQDLENPALYLAFASTCMELQLLDAAHDALEEATALAPDWEAVHFERGKLLLRLDRTAAAADAFAEAARLMPTFSAALLNLGGALGEMGRRDEARDALQRALAVDPRSHTALNNLGAVYREEGRFEEAAESFRQVIALAPSFVFGYYNLGETLLLAGDTNAARHAYEEGYARDPQKNVRQACRLAIARAASGDAAGAEALIVKVAQDADGNRASALFDEAESTLRVLSTRPDVDTAAVDRLLTVIRAYSS
jgi:tetratricopeptide (TPR) repeat protein